jgi:hypothetical protein
MLHRQAEEMERITRPWTQIQQIIEEQRAYREAFSVRRFVPDWSAQVAEMARTYQANRAWLEQIRMETTGWTELLRGFEDQRRLGKDVLDSLRLPASIWQSTTVSLTEALRGVQMMDTRPALAANLLRPLNYYSEFSRRTITQFERSPGPKREAALSAALILAEEHTVASADLLIDSLESVTNDDEATVVVEFPLVIFDVQQRELSRHPEIVEVEDYDEIVLLSPTAQLSRKARRIIQAVVTCNRAAKLLGKQEVFTPTTTFIEAQNDLVWLAVRDRTTLGRLIDALYLMLYEGAGKDKLRFMEYISDDQCDIIWVIKHLRNKLLRHDPDHGSAGGQ